ncbi:uncharacterized protein BDZ83DRAFT_620034 [Colletotrichum acutatum]|uniref:Uncharacterized protein n=1 Tax=Glomerella acutata TaxID=27357 RepID=A0AAD8XJ14_GLOAC|nr:uncharacterized protein BDZ83DRAFT_620034 [Colletotrichum acutatum]KAK1725385.1 hypothetical protein BDZ83DRAFT_620034 [Colletotrichum acutatum]
MFLPLSCSCWISFSFFLSFQRISYAAALVRAKVCWLEWIGSYGYSEVASKVVGLAVPRVRVVIDIVVVSVCCAAIYLWCAAFQSLLCTEEEHGYRE